jgi:hypothetical protein
LEQRILTVASKDIYVGVHAKITVTGKPVLEGLGGAGFYHFDKARAAALGGTGRAALLPDVDQPPKTPAKRGSQPSAGLIVEAPSQAREIEVLAWNTGAPEKDANVSHAERQVIDWFRGLDQNWQARVKTVSVTVFGRDICKMCASDIKGLKKAYPHVDFNWVRGDSGRPYR